MHTFLLFFILNCHVEVDTGILLAFVSEFYSFIAWDVMLKLGEVDPPTKLLTSNQSKNERNSRHQLLYDRSFAMISYVVGTTVEHSPQHSGQIPGTPGPADLQTEHLEKVCWIETRRQIKQAEHLNVFSYYSPMPNSFRSGYFKYRGECNYAHCLDLFWGATGLMQNFVLCLLLLCFIK